MARLICALGPDSAGGVLLRTLYDAEHAVDGSVYEVSDHFAWAFREAARRGARVRLVVDPRSGHGTREVAAQLCAGHVDCRLLSLPNAYVHSKLIVVDEATVAVGSGNLVSRDLPFPVRHGGAPLAGTREWWVVVEGAPTLARVARAHVLRNWRAGSPALGVAELKPEADGPPIHPVDPERPPLELELAPRRLRLAAGGAAVAGLEMELLSGVRRRAYVMVPYVRAAAPAVAPLLGALTSLARRNLDVRLLLGRPPDSDSEAAMLSHIEAPVRYMDSEHVAASTTGHAKGLVCDGNALVGSADWSEHGLGGNDEAAIAIQHPDAADYYGAAFLQDWELAVPLPTA